MPLAQRISYSSSLVGMVEIGHRTPSQDFVGRVDAALESGGFFERLLALARADAVPPWRRAARWRMWTPRCART